MGGGVIKITKIELHNISTSMYQKLQRILAVRCINYWNSDIYLEFEAYLQFQEFLQVKDLKDRGDFVDLERMECTPKV